MAKWEGDLYHTNTSTKEVAQLTREFIKSEKAKNKIDKDLKFSVRYRSFSGGSAIDTELVSMPDDMELYNAEKCEFWNPEVPKQKDFYCREYSNDIKDAFEKIEKNANRYNYVDSDIQSDLYNTWFYYSNRVEYKLASKKLKDTYDTYYSTGKYVPKPKAVKEVAPKIETPKVEANRENDIVEAINKYGKMVDFSGDKKKCLCKLPEVACTNIGQPSLWNKDVLKGIGIDKKDQKVLYPTLNSKNLNDTFITKVSVCLK